MAFEKFKEKHGGSGPFAQFYDAATGGQGLFGRRGLTHERELTDKLIADVQGSAELASLSAAVEVGRAPMTREQHAVFRSGVLQAALDQKTLNDNYDTFSQRLGQLSAGAQTKDEQDILATLGDVGKYAHSLISSGNPEHRQEGLQKLGEAFSGLHSYATTNEQQHLQTKAVDDGRRASARDELQSMLDNSAIALGVQDAIEYQGLYSQLDGLDPKADASPAAIAGALQYAGSNPRLSEDGHWSFSFSGVGFQDQDVPKMTNSQVRSTLDKAHNGRQQTIEGFAQNVAQQGQKKGFGLNGSNVEDLVFPLARQYHPPEQAYDPAPPAPEHIESAAKSAVETLKNVIEGASRGAVGDGVTDFFLSPMPGTEFVRRMRSGEPLFPGLVPESTKPTSAAERARARGEPGPQIQQLPVNGVVQR